LKKRKKRKKLQPLERKVGVEAKTKLAENLPKKRMWRLAKRN
jgi:hypothetical protein